MRATSEWPASGVFQCVPDRGRGICAQEIAAEIGAVAIGPVGVSLVAGCGLEARAAIHPWQARDDESALQHPLHAWLRDVDEPRLLCVPDELTSRIGLRKALAMPIQTIWTFGAFVVSIENISPRRVHGLRGLAAQVALRLEETDRESARQIARRRDRSSELRGVQAAGG
jgi:hypothetical protein